MDGKRFGHSRKKWKVVTNIQVRESVGLGWDDGNGGGEIYTQLRSMGKTHRIW